MKNTVFSLLLDTPDGVFTHSIQHNALLADDDPVSITLTFHLNGTPIIVEGDNTETAVRHLANNLPNGYTIRSCFSCRHGNFCPTGDCDNEIFCTSDVEIPDKSSLFAITSSPEERAQRSRTLFDCCAQFSPLSDQFYTYK